MTAPVPPTAEEPRPEVRLTPRAAPDRKRDWSALPGGLPAAGLWRVTGPAGSGVTSLLIDTAAARVAGGADPAGVLMITAAKDSAARAREELGDILVAAAHPDSGAADGGAPAGRPYVSDATLVRPIHSVAFALLRRAVGEVRLITGAEQDAVIRELAAGQAADGHGRWPDELRPALGFLGFSRQLRDFLLRAAERGLDPDDLVELGEAHRRPAWVGAGDFFREYRRTMNLSGARQVSASELVALALEAVRADPGLLARTGLHTVLVDDAEHLDPRSCDLVRLLLDHCARADGLGVVAGDPDQSVFRFRGASPTFLRETPVEHTLELTGTHRSPVRDIVVAESARLERAVVNDTVRRAHLVDGVEWNRIAVIVRQAGHIESVRRELLSAGVPVHVSATDIVLSEQPIVAGIILGVRALSEGLSAGELHELVLGPVGGADPVTLRRLLRGLRRFDLDTRAVQTLQRLVDPSVRPDPDEEARLAETLTEREYSVLTRIRGVLRAGHTARETGASVEEVLWEIWQATGLAEHLAAVALRGGATGSQADRDLDAVMALFDAAGDWVERRPTAGVDSFVRHVAEQELPTGVRDRRADTPQAVTVLTAHSAVGRQWERVVVTGVQDDNWPALGETGSLFEQEEFIDLVDRGVDPDLPADPAGPAGRREKLAEERRLFHKVALTRATEAVTVTAVDAPDADEPTEPSRFLDELAGQGVPLRRIGGQPADGKDGAADTGSTGGRAGTPAVGGRGLFAVLAVPDLVAELRRALTDPGADRTRRSQAARQLARLAQAGVAGADPTGWWSVRGPSDDRELVPAGPVRLSPSQIEKLDRCPLRAGLEGLIDGTETSPQLTRGTLVHAFAEAVERGVAPETARRLVSEAWQGVLQSPSWARERDLQAFEELLANTRAWLAARDGAFEFLGAEVDVCVDIGSEVTVAGRIDRLDRERDSGENFVVDLKTGRSTRTKKEAEEQTQLFAYQLALARGRLTETAEGRVTVRTGGPHPPRGGALLVYPAVTTKKGITVREQSPKSTEELDALAAGLPALAAARRGPRLAARLNKECTNCRLQAVCPAQPQGRTTTDA